LVLSPTGSINLGFTTEGKLAAVLIITFSWGFPTSFLASTTRLQDNNQAFLAPLPGRKKISARGVSHFQSFTFLLFFFILLLLALFYQKYKKISSFIVVIFTCLLFSLAK
jgi:uncharacterized membrane protein